MFMERTQHSGLEEFYLLRIEHGLHDPGASLFKRLKVCMPLGMVGQEMEQELQGF